MGRPSGYDRSHVQPSSRGDCLIGVGFSMDPGRVTAFLVNLQYACNPVTGDYTQIARFDHNETSAWGHDVRREGHHLDVARKFADTVRYWPAAHPLPPDLGIVIRTCSEYLYRHADFFVDVYETRRRPESVPPWRP